MNKARIKIGVWLGVSLLLLIGGGWAFGALGEWAARNRRQADPAAAMNLPPHVPAGAPAALVWLPDAADTGRVMEPYTRRQIESAYLRAWAQWNGALAGGDPAGLATYFAGPGLTAVTEGIQAVAGSGFHVAQRNQSHALQLHLYAADGSIVAFTDTQADIVQTVRDRVGALLAHTTFAVRYDVVMFLEDGNWRIRHWVRRDQRPTVEASR